MKPKIQDPVERVDDSALGGKVISHPTFGQITACRVNGSAILYGSDMEHRNTIRLTISRSTIRRSLHDDWLFPREELIEVEMSEAQWGTLISSLNVGSGPPCTIRYIRGEGHTPYLPLRVEEDKFHDELKADQLPQLPKGNEDE